LDENGAEKANNLAFDEGGEIPSIA